MNWAKMIPRHGIVAKSASGQRTPHSGHCKCCPVAILAAEYFCPLSASFEPLKTIDNKHYADSLQYMAIRHPNGDCHWLYERCQECYDIILSFH